MTLPIPASAEARSQNISEQILLRNKNLDDFRANLRNKNSPHHLPFPLYAEVQD